MMRIRACRERRALLVARASGSWLGLNFWYRVDLVTSFSSSGVVLLLASTAAGFCPARCSFSKAFSSLSAALAIISFPGSGSPLIWVPAAPPHSRPPGGLRHMDDPAAPICEWWTDGSVSPPFPGGVVANPEEQIHTFRFLLDPDALRVDAGRDG